MAATRVLRRSSGQRCRAAVPRLGGLAMRSLGAAGVVVEQKEIRGVVASYKYKPTDLRDKKTRAIRRRLTVSEVRAGWLLFFCFCRVTERCAQCVPADRRCQLDCLFCACHHCRWGLSGGCAAVQKNVKTERQQKKESNFPIRRYAIKA